MGGFRKKSTGKTPPPIPEPEVVPAVAEAPGGALAASSLRRRQGRRSRGRASLLLAGDVGQANIGRKTLTGQ